MGVAYKVSDDWEVVVIKRNRSWFCICLDLWVILGEEGKPSKLGARGFAPHFEENSVV